MSRRHVWQFALFGFCALACWSCTFLSLASPHVAAAITASFSFGSAAYVALSFWLRVSSVVGTIVASLLLGGIPMVIGASMAVDHSSAQARGERHSSWSFSESSEAVWLGVPLGLSLAFHAYLVSRRAKR